MVDKIEGIEVQVKLPPRWERVIIIEKLIWKLYESLKNFNDDGAINVEKCEKLRFVCDNDIFFTHDGSSPYDGMKLLQVSIPPAWIGSISPCELEEKVLHSLKHPNGKRLTLDINDTPAELVRYGHAHMVFRRIYL